uniref:Uncharacterized protein n=2 Tax=Plectus sambesii TaxID=2011161 RepID=A0A914X3R9_9BILA
MAVLGIALLIGAIVALVATALLKHLRLRRQFAACPGPRSFPLIGNAAQLKMKPEDFMDQTMGTCMMFPAYPRMQNIWLATEPYVMLYGAEVVEVVLSSGKHIDKGFEYNMLHPWLGRGLLTSASTTWRPRRKLLTPTFHYDILKDFVEVFNQQSKILLGILRPFAESGKSFDVSTYIASCALDIICESAMGRSVNAQLNHQSDYVKAIIEINDIIHKRQKNPLSWPNFLFWHFGNGKRHAWCLEVLHGFTQKVIDERKAEIDKLGGMDEMMNALQDKRNNNVGDDDVDSKKQRLAFLDLLLDLVDRQQMPMADVRPEVDTFMFEGHDTTSSAMTWTLHLLGCYPEVQRRVHAELDALFGDDARDITFEDIGSLKYLECCVKETLRLFPSVPMFTRVLKHDQPIDGLVVPAGTQVVIVSYMVHRDPKHWPDPEVFDPDRFSPQQTAGRHPYAFLPFSAGGRNCIGQRFAMMEEKTVLAWLLRYFEVESVQRRDQ